MRVEALIPHGTAGVNWNEVSEDIAVKEDGSRNVALERNLHSAHGLMAGDLLSTEFLQCLLALRLHFLGAGFQILVRLRGE